MEIIGPVYHKRKKNETFLLTKKKQTFLIQLFLLYLTSDVYEKKNYNLNNRYLSSLFFFFNFF